MARQLGIASVEELDVEQIDVELTESLKVGFCRDSLLLPLWPAEDRIQVAIADPLNLAGLDALRLLLDKPLEPVVVPEQELVGRHQQGSLTGERRADAVLDGIGAGRGARR